MPLNATRLGVGFSPLGLNQGSGLRFSHHRFRHHYRRMQQALALDAMLTVWPNSPAGLERNSEGHDTFMSPSSAQPDADARRHDRSSPRAADRPRQCAVRRLEGRHHGIADGLHDAPFPTKSPCSAVKCSVDESKR